MGMPIKGFFNVADIVVEAMASAFVAEHGAPVEVSIHPPKPILVEESTQTERVCEFVPIPAEIPTPQKEVTPTGASQIGSASPATSLVIFSSDLFVALSQAIVRDRKTLGCSQKRDLGALKGTSLFG